MSLKSLFNKFTKGFRSEYRSLWVDDIPEMIQSNKIYIVGIKNNPWVLVFICPCGCKKIIHLNLLPGTHPHWSYRISFRNRVSISPSIKRISGCKSHFHIKKGIVIWSAF